MRDPQDQFQMGTQKTNRPGAPETVRGHFRCRKRSPRGSQSRGGGIPEPSRTGSEREGRGLCSWFLGSVRPEGAMKEN